MLYMDDTTLVAKTKGGLKSLTEKYMRFCRKFRMRLNHKKSKVMHYRTVFGAVGEPEDAGYEAGGVRFEQPKAPTTDPGIGRRQPYLGFLTDEALSGKAHYNKALAMGHAQAGKVGDISAKMGEDMGLMYLKGVVGPKVLYDMELTGMQYKPNRLRGLWEKLLSKATLVADDDERGSFLSRRDSFTRKTGLMSETNEVPWDIQVQGRAAGLWRRIRTQGNTLAGKSFAKPVLAGTAREALGRHMAGLGVRQQGGATKWAWAKLTKGKMAEARKGRLRNLVREAGAEGPLRSDEAYMKSVTAQGQAGKWAGVVPAFGTRVRFRRYRLGLMDGAAQMVARRTHRFESVRKDLPGDVLDCPHCGVMESGNHVVLHCPQTQGVWDEAIKVAGEDVQGTPVGAKWGGMTRQSQVDHLLSSEELGDRATEVCLRARATKALVTGFALVDASLKVDRDPIRARATELVKAKSAKARGKAKAAKEASPSPRPPLAGDGSSPLTPSAQGAGDGGLLTSEDAA